MDLVDFQEQPVKEITKKAKEVRIVEDKSEEKIIKLEEEFKTLKESVETTKREPPPHFSGR